MSFINDFLPQRLGRPQRTDSIDELAQHLIRTEGAKEKQRVPDEEILYNRELTDVLSRLSGVLTHLKDQFDDYAEDVQSHRRERAAKELGNVTEAVLNQPWWGHDSVGDALQGHLADWLQNRAYHLDRVHRDAKALHEQRRQQEGKDFLVYRFEDIDDALPDAFQQFTMKYSLSDVPDVGRTDDAERCRRENMRFPTEEQAHEFLFNTVIEEVADKDCLDELTLMNAYGDGALRITSENHTVFPNEEPYPPTIISRAKQGQEGSVGSEPYKLWKSLFGERDDYSYDSIALWHTNFEAGDLMETMLYYFHDPTTSNGDYTDQHAGRPDNPVAFYHTARHGQSGFNVHALNHTPGSPFDFHRRLARQAPTSDNHQAVQGLAQLMPKERTAQYKRRQILRWVKKAEPVNAQDEAFRSVLDETKETLVKDYDAFLRAIIKPRDKALVRNAETSTYSFSSTMPGWKGTITRRHQRPPFQQDKAGEVNVPFEAFFSEPEHHYRKGAGQLSGATGPGSGLGNHASYKAKRTDRYKELQQAGYHHAYHVIADRFPTLAY